MKTSKKITLLGLSLAGLALLALPQSGKAFELQERWSIKGGIFYENNKIVRFENGYPVDIQVLNLPKSEKIEWKVTLNGQDQTANFLGQEKDRSIVGEEGRFLNFYVPYGYRGDIKVEAKHGNEVKSWSSKVVDDAHGNNKSSYYTLEEGKDSYTKLDVTWNAANKTYTGILPASSHGKPVLAWRGADDEGLTLDKPGKITRTYNESRFLSFSPVFENSSWLAAGSDWYYQRQGELLKNSWFKYKGVWYYLTDNGKMYSQEWLSLGDVWYAFKPNGDMIAKDWLYSGKKWYYLKDSGAMASSEWLYDGGKWYYLSASGAMDANSWVYYGSDWYYLKDSGAMASNQWIYDGGKWYYLNASGEMLHDTYTPDGYYVGASGAWQ